MKTSVMSPSRIGKLALFVFFVAAAAVADAQAAAGPADAACPIFEPQAAEGADVAPDSMPPQPIRRAS